MFHRLGILVFQYNSNPASYGSNSPVQGCCRRNFMPALLILFIYNGEKRRHEISPTATLNWRIRSVRCRIGIVLKYQNAKPVKHLRFGRLYLKQAPLAEAE